MSRPKWDEYFMKLAFVTAERSTCQRHHVGALMVLDRRILSGGYNGAPSGQSDCTELGCLRNESGIPSGTMTEICRAVHAEENAIIQAAMHGMRIKGSTVYCTHSPCRRCAKMLCNVGIIRYVTCFDYDDAVFRGLFDMAKIVFEKIPVPGHIIDILV